ncbi:hypothetical protein ACBI99_41600 [Nonomuraea sp. ATR24]|uniref:hypothetical protein n=1 Tax=Nonomuraea TaxID=83681 RepID=UPI001C5F08A9|nr:hypothetical protein [Nonomuraea ceibae]
MKALGRRSKLFRVLAPLVAIMVISTGTVVSTATGALAGITSRTDDLEGVPQTRWQGGGDGDGIAGYDINQPVARSGVNNGWLYVGNGWAANRIPITLDGGFVDRYNCAVGVWVNVLYSGAFVGLQVWNPNGWHIIAETYPWVTGGGYKQISMSGLNLQGYSGTIYLQVIFGNSNGVKTWVRFDDMSIACTNPY